MIKRKNEVLFSNISSLDGSFDSKDLLIYVFISKKMFFSKLLLSGRKQSLHYGEICI